jgi:uncharacterized membrane protein required for colicin V production
MPFNWFDVLVVIVLMFGLLYGRRKGMSKELLPLAQWFILLPVCGFGCPPLAKLLSGVIPSALWSHLLAYLAPALVIWSIFKLLKHMVAKKLGMTDFFKGSEYPLGMLAGAVHFECVLLFVLALLNAPFYSPQDIAKQKAFDQKNFGGGLYSGSYFPHVFTIQSMVFKESFVGPRIKDGLGVLLIDTADAAKAQSAPPAKNAVITIGGKPVAVPAQPAKSPAK